jgi:hypothetical protein
MSQLPSRAAGRARAEGRVGCGVCGQEGQTYKSGQRGSGPSRWKSGVRRVRAGGPNVQERAAGQRPEPMGEWSAESEALGLVLLKGRKVPAPAG